MVLLFVGAVLKLSRFEDCLLGILMVAEAEVNRIIGNNDFWLLLIH